MVDTPKNKRLDGVSKQDSPPNQDSGRSSPAIRNAHLEKHHSYSEDSPDAISDRKARRASLGKRIQHGLQKESSRRNTGLPNDCYIGLAFRVLETEDDIEKYKRETGNVSKSKVDLSKGEKLLTWNAIVSDGQSSKLPLISSRSILRCLYLPHLL
jgi:hypothetical protein